MSEQTTNELISAYGNKRTTELRVIARDLGIRFVGPESTPVNKGRKADILNAIRALYAELDNEGKKNEMPKLTATYEGQTYSKSTNHEYKFAAILRNTKTGDTMAVWSRTEAGARRNAARMDSSRADKNLHEVLAVVPVDGDKPKPAAKKRTVKARDLDKWPTDSGKKATGEKKSTVPADAGLAKAKRFADDAKAAGWTATARKGQQAGVAVVTARAPKGQPDESITLVWNNGAYDFDRSEHKNAKGSRKVRNASAGRTIMERTAVSA